jgi:hypothetical protein
MKLDLDVPAGKNGSLRPRRLNAQGKKLAKDGATGNAAR